MSFFQDPSSEPTATDLASRIGAVFGNILVVIAYLIVIYPVAYSFFRQ